MAPAPSARPCSDALIPGKTGPAAIKASRCAGLLGHPAPQWRPSRQSPLHGIRPDERPHSPPDPRPVSAGGSSLGQTAAPALRDVPETHTVHFGLSARNELMSM